MIKISTVVEQILSNDEVGSTALARGVLNLSAYAKRIRKEVETRTKKSVKPGAIVTALSRMSPGIKNMPRRIPDVSTKDISLKTEIVELSYERTAETISKLGMVQKVIERKAPPSFMTTTVGVKEITVLVSAEFVEDIETIFSLTKPRLKLKDLVAITIHLADNAISTPNITYALLRRIALKNINLVEIVSTYTELTFIVARKDSAAVIELFR
ncbi:MAG TPA: hypothetical protein VJG48_00780 [Candidatus Paceibacterota bacterium]